MKRFFVAMAAAVLFSLSIISPAHADYSGTMTFPEFGRVYLGETIDYVQVNDTGGDGHNCSCTGINIASWTSGGYDHIKQQYLTGLTSPAYAVIQYRFANHEWHARQKWWGSTEYNMPAAP